MSAAMAGLKEDVKKVPSWVWFGTAAGAGLLWVLHRATSSSTAGSSTTPGTATSANIGTPVAGSTDYSTTSAIDSLQTLDQQILEYLQNGGTASTGTGSTGTTGTGTGSTGTTGTGTTGTGTSNGGSFASSYPQGVVSIGKFAGLPTLTYTSADTTKSYVSLNGAPWQAFGDFLKANPGYGTGLALSGEVPYTGAGTYGSTQVGAVPS